MDLLRANKRIIVLAVSFSLVTTVASAGCLSGQLTTAEKVEDFRYLYQIFKDNHPYLALKARVEGYDWLAHEKEFEEAVARTRDDREFAITMNRIVSLVNNGHTGIVGGSLFDSVKRSGSMPWQDAISRTTKKKADYWAMLATESTGNSLVYPPFVAVYSSGDYVVVDVAPHTSVQEKVKIGYVVKEINGTPVHEYVASQRGIAGWLRWDPLRMRLYAARLPLPRWNGDLLVTFTDSTGSDLQVQVPCTVSQWKTDYIWPPRYTATGKSSANVYATTLAGGTVGYIQVRSMSHGVASDEQLTKKFFEENRDLKAIIIDIRGNGGGSDTFWTYNLLSYVLDKPVVGSFYVTWRSGEYVLPFLRAKLATELPEISKEELLALAEDKSRIPREILTDKFVNPRKLEYTIQPRANKPYSGKIYLLVDNLVYSASESFAAFCKRTGLATLVGECTGGDGIAFDPAILCLPNSGMLVRFPLNMGLNPDFTANEECHTTPDVLVGWKHEDLVKYAQAARVRAVKGPDPEWDTVLRECLELIAWNSSDKQGKPSRFIEIAAGSLPPLTCGPGAGAPGSNAPAAVSSAMVTVKDLPTTTPVATFPQEGISWPRQDPYPLAREGIR
ncbi:MAG: hypothetical protein IMW97_04395 [Firmicutes bacterium]|nr:hypothetical protein [Candidatus Fermentithermobacillaceae bacterium]